MSETLQSVLVVNGDSYSNNRHKDNGTIIRNGVVYRSQPTDSETCVLNWDGTMDIYEPGEADVEQLMKKARIKAGYSDQVFWMKTGRQKKLF